MHTTNGRCARSRGGLGPISSSRRVAVVGGASRGIGRATAVQLARDGADLALFGRDENALGETVAAARAARRDAVVTAHAFDATCEAATNGAVAEALAAHGRIDVTVANAGQSVDGLLLRLQQADLERLLAANLRSASYLCAAVSEPMLHARGGAIVLVSSVAGLVGSGGRSAYAANKAALLGLAASLAKELGPRGIRVDLVAPDLIETEMPAAMPPAARLRHAELIALGRTGSSAEVASAVAFLASDDARRVTGQTALVGAL